jgi:flagellar biosynthesis/type III secretory pathway M-ring protein FliF/YscJ
MADATQKEQYMSYAHLGALVLGPLLLLGALFFILKRSRPKNAKVVAAEEAPKLAAPSLDLESAAPAAPVPARPGKAVAQPIMEDPEKIYIRDQIQTLGKSNPATVAQLIQTWMDEDRRN